MKVIISDPTKAYVSGTDEEVYKLKKLLTYTNTSAQFQYRKILKNRWWKNRDPDGWAKACEDLKCKIKSVLVFEDSNGIFVRPASLSYLEPYFSDMSQNTVVKVSFPNPRPFPWHNPLPFILHPYQDESIKNLISVKHGNVQLCTGAGKSAIILKIARDLGLKTVVAVPSVSIFNEMLKNFEHHFGKSSVGALGDGKKRLGKLFTVAISNSLRNLSSESAEYKEIASADVLLVDESHLWGADTLEELCHSLFCKTPYRMFFSGTQTRSNGTEVLLQSIIGKTVCTLTTEDAVKKRYVCDHDFTIIKVPTQRPSYSSDDPIDMKRKHLLNNENVAILYAKIANSSAKVKGESTLVLVEEIHQIALIAKFLEVPYAYAHGNTGNKSELSDLGLSKSNAEEAVEKFNKGEVKVLIGTSCISTGTNIYPTHNTCNWQGGSSEIKTKQGTIGRSVRHLKGSKYEKFHSIPKMKTKIYDVDVIGVPAPTNKDGSTGISDLKRQLIDRIDCYRDSGTQIRYIG